MFSNFKNIVNSSLQELERLGEESLANLEKQRQEGGGFARAFSPPPRNSTDLAPGQRPVSASGAGGQRPGLSVLGDGQRPVTASGSLQAIAAAGAGAHPPSVSPRDSSDGFPSFGLSGLKRSLSGLPRSSLDLPGIRSSLDGGSRSSNSLPSAVTPSKESRELGELPVPPPSSSSNPATNFAFASASPAQSGPPPVPYIRGHSHTASLSSLPPLKTSPARLKRRSSARAASFSSGPYTPDTMMKQDPFFFVTLQALPDELKQAAFTPLPTEDDDEFLEETHADLQRRDSMDFLKQTQSQPINLPQLVIQPTRTPSNSVPNDFMPVSWSAPATDVAGFSFPVSPSVVRSPLSTEQSEFNVLPSVADVHADEEQEAENDAKKAGAADQSEPEASPAGHATPLPQFDDLPNEDEPQLLSTVADTPQSSDPLLRPNTSNLSLPSLGLSRSPSTALSVGSSRSFTPTITETNTPKTKDSERLAEILPVYKRLQAEKVSADKLLKQYTALTSVGDLAALEAFLKEKSMPSKEDEKAMSSKDEEIETLRKKLQGEETLKARIQTLENDLNEAKASTSRAETKAKDEEEKKAKSISLLKAVRQKLIKAEKDKEDAELLRDQSRSNEEAYSNQLRALQQRSEQEILSLRSAQEQQLNKLKASFEREANSIRTSYEREMSARKGQADLDMLNLKSASNKEIANRDARIATLEGNVRDVRREKDDLFDQLQLKSAEVESAVAEQERKQITLDEMRYESKESSDRISALQDEVASFKKARLDATRDEGHTRRLLSELESTHSEKVQTYEDRIRVLERERTDVEESMARKLQDKLREVDKMRREIERRDAENGEETLRREERQARTDKAEALNRSLSEKISGLEILLQELRDELDRGREEQGTAKELLDDQTRRTEELEVRNEELQTKEAQLRTSNKTLRDELRKVQSGVLLSEKSRNPGVGYFSNFSNPSVTNVSGTDTLRSPPPASPALSSRSLTNGDEKETHHTNPSAPSQSDAPSSDEQALNFEYIRNVILQFLEHREMRPHLVSVLGVILQFTPAELRRLTAKASA